MDLANSFIPAVGDGLGLLEVATYYVMMVAFFCFVASFFFSWFTRTHVAPEHNTSRVFTAIICVVAGISYFIISDYYKDFLQELQTITDETTRNEFKRNGYNAIGQLRYMDWMVTTPLLLIKMISVLRIKYSRIAVIVALVVLGDIFMIATGFIGQQQLDADGSIMVQSRMIWGAISTVGYTMVLVGMYQIWNKYRHEAKTLERRAYKYMSLTVVTLWGVYPIGYILVALFPEMDNSWIHITFSIADVVNKAGVGIIAYLMASRLLEDRLDTSSKEFAMNVG
ncbi:bacteriorhodopsin [Nonlabens ponticola]|uniref:Rhodopsin n=1 Tax=Nonlabens ponticola TaxID=2496866 RepID=A0A3S9MUF4_9FLAO|nr:bacteriorhodopsin [Nonlabens ponticola]AZQ42805.1 hypothetical protein EJ995_00595 [Nonlabens ponticola]